MEDKDKQQKSIVVANRLCVYEILLYLFKDDPENTCELLFIDRQVQFSQVVYNYIKGMCDRADYAYKHPSQDNPPYKNETKVWEKFIELF